MFESIVGEDMFYFKWKYSIFCSPLETDMQSTFMKNSVEKNS